MTDDHPAPTCRFCGSELRHTFVDLGRTPLANSYLSEADLASPEPSYPLHARVCHECFLVQVDDVVPPEAIFEEYSYFSSYSDSWVAHAKRFAESAIGRFGLTGTSQVVEVASNDGYLLRHFKAAGIPVLGVEPAGNVAEAAKAEGIPTRVAFFGSAFAQELAARDGQADLIVGNNVLAHVPDLNDFVGGLATVLKPDGVLSMEFPHLLQLIEQNQFDTIYHEHFSYFSLSTVERVFARHGLTVFDVERLPTHGGSLRVFACRQGSGAHRPTPAVAALRDVEQTAALDRPQGYENYAERVGVVCDGLRQFLAAAKAKGETVAAYGAAAKGNTLLNTCGIGSDLIAFVVDRNPHKQGRYLPGSHLPILPPEAIFRTRPDHVLILPWNLKDEVAASLADVRSWGGQLLVAVPKLEILN